MAWTIPTLTAWNPAHLEAAAAFATEQAPLWLEHFEGYRDRLAAMDSWQGMSKEGAWEAASWSATTAGNAAYPTVNGAAQMTEIASAAMAMKSLVLDQIGVATASGLVVSPDLKQVTGPPGMQEEAQAAADMIKHYLGQFQSVLDDGARRIQAHAEDLSTIGFPDTGVKLSQGHTEPHVSMVDGKFKLGGQDFKLGGGDDPWDNQDVPSLGDQGQDSLLGPGTGQGASTQSGLGSQDTKLPAMPSQWPPTEAAPANCLTPDQVKDKLGNDFAKGAVLGAIPGGVMGGPVGALGAGATAGIFNDAGDLLDMADGTTKLCEK